MKRYNRKSISISKALYDVLNDHCNQTGVAVAGLVEATMREKLGMNPRTPNKRSEAKGLPKVVNGTMLVSGQVSSFSVSSDGAVEKIMVRPL